MWSTMHSVAPIFPPDAPSLADGRYVLVSRIGEGGIAAVYRGYDKKLRVWRAVKLLMPEFSRRKSMCQRLEAEALTMAQLEHPNLVRVYDVGFTGAVPFLVMELVSGGTLHHWTEQHGPMPAQLAVEATRQVLRGLGMVHERGVVHRDVKPRNVLVTPNGTCKLTDFGIAYSEFERKARTPKMLGTLGYSAPEQLADPSSVDVRADLYSVGALLWHLCTARDVVEELYRAEEDPSLLHGIDEALHPVLLGCVARDREQRYDTAEQVYQALQDLLPSLPPAPPDTPDLRVDVSVLEQSLEHEDFPELAQVREAMHRRPDSKPPVLIDTPLPNVSLSISPLSPGPLPESSASAALTPGGSARQKPLPYVMQTPDPAARRRAILGGPSPADEELPSWIDTSSPSSPARPTTSSTPMYKELLGDLGPAPIPGGNGAAVDDPAEAGSAPEEEADPAAAGAPEHDLGSGGPPPPPQAEAPPSEPKPEYQVFEHKDLPKEAQGSSDGHSDEPEERSLWMWALAVPLFLLVGVGTVFALAFTIYVGNGMLALSDAAVATENSQLHLYRVLTDQRDVVNELATLGADRSQLEREYIDYMQERDPARRLVAARIFIESVERESPRIDEAQGQTQVAHRVRKLRSALREYDEGMQSWQAASSSGAGKLAIAVGLAQPAP
jgi:serine/threonine protein kinase